jgi:hypothetical protein
MSVNTKYRPSRSGTGWRPKVRKKLFQSRLVKQRSLEDSIDFLSRKGILAQAGALAIKELHSKGLPATIMEGTTIYDVYPDGRREVIKANLPAPKIIRQRYLQIPD